MNDVCIAAEPAVRREAPADRQLDQLKELDVNSHTDAPVALPNLMQVMWATVNRTSRSGKVMGADERLTPEEGLKTIKEGKTVYRRN